MRQPPQAPHAMLQRLGRLEAGDLAPVRGGRNSERGKAAIHPDKPVSIAGGPGCVAALGMQVGGMDVEAEIPAGAVPSDRGEQDLGTRRHYGLPGGGVQVGGRASSRRGRRVSS